MYMMSGTHRNGLPGSQASPAESEPAAEGIIDSPRVLSRPDLVEERQSGCDQNQPAI